jgi:hypothetical protein
MTIVDSLFGLLTETEDLEWVIRKHPPLASLMDMREESAYGESGGKSGDGYLFHADP